MTCFYQLLPFFPFTITIPSSQHIDQELIELLHFFLPSKTMPTLILLRMMQSASRRAANLLRTLRSIYHHHFFEQKKTANSTDSNKVAPEKKTHKKYGYTRLL